MLMLTSKPSEDEDYDGLDDAHLDDTYWPVLKLLLLHLLLISVVVVVVVIRGHDDVVDYAVTAYDDARDVDADVAAPADNICYGQLHAPALCCNSP